MLQPSPLDDGTVPDYRFGLEWTRRGDQDVVFRGGSLWGFHTLLLRLPQQRMSIILLSNSERVEPEWEQLADACIKECA